MGVKVVEHYSREVVGKQYYTRLKMLGFLVSFMNFSYSIVYNYVIWYLYIGRTDCWYCLWHLCGPELQSKQCVASGSVLITASI